jgi:cytochrome P450
MAEIPLPDNRISLRALRAILRQKSVLPALEVFHSELGDVFGIPLPGFNPVMLVGPEANHFVLVEGYDDLRWRAEQDPITRLLRHGVLVEDGDTHDSLRRQMNPALHKRMLESYTDTMWRCTDTITKDWGDAPLDMLVEMRLIALLILTRTLFNVDFEPELRRLWGAILRALGYISPGPWIVWPGMPRPGYKRALKKMDDYLHQIIHLRRESKWPENDMLGLLIASGMPDALIRDQLLTMIIAGHDTSTALLSWALYALSSRPEIQSKVQHEIDTVLGSSPPDYARISELHYLKQVMNETLRLYPPIHLGSRIAARDIEFQGFRIPAGRRVVYSIYLTHRDARYWHNPADFIPERFSTEQARQPYTFLPFGGGPRNCIGMAFAQVEVKAVLVRILQKFDLVFTGHPVRLQMGATLEPHPGVRVSVRRRS